ncbi:MAG: hypothetical protein WC028_09500 [Candidatus Obscuribacterales bacterium]
MQISFNGAGVFEPEQFATHVLAGAATNMIGAAIGAIAGDISAKTGDTLARAGDVSARTLDRAAQNFEPAAVNQAQRNFPGSTAREYQMVGNTLPVAEMMATF